MGKLSARLYDPDFKLHGRKVVVNARDTPSSKRQKNGKLNIKRWNSMEQQKYLNFVNNNQQKFLQAKKWKIFTLMANYIKSRNCDQCKSHHGKLVQKYNNSIQKLIQQQLFYVRQIHIEGENTSNFEVVQQQQLETDQISSLNQQNKRNQNVIDNQDKTILWAAIIQQKELFSVLTL